MVITWLGYFLFPTGHLPDMRPHFFLFFVEELLADVAIYREILVSHVGVMLNAEVVGYVDCFQIQQILPSGADKPASVSLLLVLCICHRLFL